MMLSVDPTTRENGCLEISVDSNIDHPLRKLLEMNSDLTIHKEEVERLNWRLVETDPGDLVLFDSYLPHRSGPNNSKLPRSVLYATYNRVRDGDVRDGYFQKKRAEFPPDVERESGRRCEPNSIFNVGNPVATRI